VKNSLILLVFAISAVGASAGAVECSSVEEKALTCLENQIDLAKTLVGRVELKKMLKTSCKNEMDALAQVCGGKAKEMKDLLDRAALYDAKYRVPADAAGQAQ